MFTRLLSNKKLAMKSVTEFMENGFDSDSEDSSKDSKSNMNMSSAKSSINKTNKTLDRQKKKQR